MTIADLIQSMIDSSKERIKNPIVGAFICSFLVYNWKPISILFLSSVSIEKRIQIISTEEYSKASAVYNPMIIALIYTIAIPFIMIVIDTILVFTKKQRIKNIYVNKTNTIDEKIKLASKILELKNIESGNQEKQELIDKISYLEETNSQLDSSHKKTVNQLNASLKEVSDVLEVMNERHTEVVKELKDLRSEQERMAPRTFGISNK